MIRVDGRAPDQIRPISITPDYQRHAEGSALVEFGKTKVICSASVDNKVPPHLAGKGQGWITAEYALLPRSCHKRVNRERPGPSGRSYEIQRLIGRSLRAVTDMNVIGERTIIVDCDVVEADGGTRTAAITGGFVALALAFRRLKEQRHIGRMPLTDYIAAVSVGLVEGEAVTDLCYLEDMQADVDMNIAMTGRGLFVEVQGTAEKSPFSREQMNTLLDLASKSIMQLIEIQRSVLQLNFEV